MGQVPILLPRGRVLVDICALPHFDDMIHNIIIRGNGGKCKGDDVPSVCHFRRESYRDERKTGA